MPTTPHRLLNIVVRVNEHCIQRWLLRCVCLYCISQASFCVLVDEQWCQQDGSTFADMLQTQPILVQQISPKYHFMFASLQFHVCSIAHRRRHTVRQELSVWQHSLHVWPWKSMFAFRAIRDHSCRFSAARCSPKGCPAQPSCNTTWQPLAESATLSTALTQRLHCCRLEQLVLHACVPQQLRPLTMLFLVQV